LSAPPPLPSARAQQLTQRRGGEALRPKLNFEFVGEVILPLKVALFEFVTFFGAFRKLL